jgi:hydroxymethylpyrimidine/phosphomethylpyrimidine kinase
LHGRVLIVAGSDSGGGAGIQADIKAVTALGGYAATAISALTIQDTRDVHGMHEVPPEFVARQIEVVLADIGADCMKTGMLHTAPVVEAVLGVLAERAPQVPLVVDPVMVAKGGAELLKPDTVDVVRTRLLPRANILTPNLPEAELLTGQTIATLSDMERTTEALLALGPRAVLLKGGHLRDPAAGGRVIDLLATADGIERFESPRIETTNTHGTGCTLASGIACGIAQGMAVRDAVGRAREYVWEAIRTAPGYGAGHGPLNHAHTVVES